jgi:hypothetical protein
MPNGATTRWMSGVRSAELHSRPESALGPLRADRDGHSLSGHPLPGRGGRDRRGCCLRGGARRRRGHRCRWRVKRSDGRACNGGRRTGSHRTAAWLARQRQRRRTRPQNPIAWLQRQNARTNPRQFGAIRNEPGSSRPLRTPLFPFDTAWGRRTVSASSRRVGRRKLWIQYETCCPLRRGPCAAVRRA